jgi:hypothetical protein
MATAKPAVAVTLSPERQALADAQERLRLHDAELAALRENDAARTEYSFQCLGAVDAAEAELRKATPRPVSRMAKDLRGHRYDPDPEPPEHLVEAVQTARQRQVEAEAQRDALKAELRAAEEDRKRLYDAVDRAAWVVEAKHAADIGLADEVARLQRAAYDAGLKLMLLYNAGLITVKSEGPWPTLRPVMQTLHRIAAYEPFSEDLDDLEGGRSWTAAHDWLMSDPTAEIP